MNADYLFRGGRANPKGSWMSPQETGNRPLGARSGPSRAANRRRIADVQRLSSVSNLSSLLVQQHFDQLSQRLSGAMSFAGSAHGLQMKALVATVENNIIYVTDLPYSDYPTRHRCVCIYSH